MQMSRWRKRKKKTFPPKIKIFIELKKKKSVFAFNFPKILFYKLGLNQISNQWHIQTDVFKRRCIIKESGGEEAPSLKWSNFDAQMCLPNLVKLFCQ